MPTPLDLTPAALGAQLERIAAQVPADKRGALQADVTSRGAQVEVGLRLAPAWTVGAWAGRTWTGLAEGGLRVKGSW